MLELLLVVTVAQVPANKYRGEDRVDDRVAPIDLSAITVEKPDSPRQIPVGERVYCLPTTAGGEVEVFCDPARKECLVAPLVVLDEGGQESATPVQRSPCKRDDVAKRIEVLPKQGYRFIKAVAAAPAGWYRDERGRVMQANFDFTRRVWVGGGWAPGYQGALAPLRGRVDFGIAASFSQDRVLHQLRVLEGQVWFDLNRNVSIDATLARYWFNLNPVDPPLFLTTFVGKPRRFDLPVSFSAYVDIVRLEELALLDKTFVTLGTACALMDVWHSRDLESFVRVRAGVGAELAVDSGAFTARPEAALEADLTLDADGFHHLTANVTGEKVFLGEATNPWRFRAKAGYEVILLAVNDYPLTLVLDARATYREDSPGPGATAASRWWDLGANAGLRMSFWAPARRTAAALGPVAPPVTAPAPVPAVPVPPAAAPDEATR